MKLLAFVAAALVGANIGEITSTTGDSGSFDNMVQILCLVE